MKFSFLFIPVFAFSLVQAQTPEIPAEANDFLIPPMGVLDYITGDLNGDKRPDAIMILKSPGEDTIVGEELNRPLLILIRQPDGKLKQMARNDEIVMCRQCGGVFGDPYAGVTIKGNRFTISFYGGSSWRWAYTYDFVYRPLKKNWYFVKETEENFQAGDPEATMKESVVEETELGTYTIEQFKLMMGYRPDSWDVIPSIKVVSPKAFFYDNPKLGSKPGKAFVLKGDMVHIQRVLKNFVEVTYQDKKEKITSGYMLRKDLEPFKW